MDVKLQISGSIILITPKSEIGHEWIDEHCHEGFPFRFGDTIVTSEERVDAILEQLDYDGMEWELTR